MNRPAEAFLMDFKDGTTSIVEGFDLIDAVKQKELVDALAKAFAKAEKFKGAKE